MNDRTEVTLIPCLTFENHPGPPHTRSPPALLPHPLFPAPTPVDPQPAQPSSAPILPAEHCLGRESPGPGCLRVGGLEVDEGGPDPERAVPSSPTCLAEARSGRVPDGQGPGAVVRDPRLVTGLEAVQGTQSFFLEGGPPQKRDRRGRQHLP